MSDANTALTRDTDHHLLKVDGMSCAGCVRTVETALAAVPGVESASVSFANESAAVIGDVPTTALIDAVQKAGYSARPLKDESLELEAEKISRDLLAAVLRSAIALVAGGLLMADMKLDLLPPIANTIPWVFVGLIALSVMMMTGGHFYRGAIAALKNGSATMDTLIFLGTGTAWLYSMVVILVPAIIPVESRHQFFEAALFIIGFVNLGKALESHARSRASLAIRRLFDLAPRFVIRIDGDGREQLVAVAAVNAGDRLRVKPGENFPVDGQIREGSAAINESMLTGESEPVLRETGDTVRAGTTNLDSSLVIEATGVGSETLLAQMVQLVQEAQNSKPPLGHLVDRITSVFVPGVIMVALVTATVWLSVGPEPRLSYALVTAMSVLIIACPCALGLAIPMSIMVGLGRAAAQGLLVRNSEILQTASVLTTIVMDKTGTITRGEPEVFQTRGLDETDLQLCLEMERHSEHPLARAIVRYCESGTRGQSAVNSEPITDFSAHAGGGVSARSGSRRLLLGSSRFLESQGVCDPPGVNEAGSLVWFAVDGELKGHFLLQDAIREEARGVIASLQELGLRTVMLTGDRQAIAEQVAEETGFDEVHAGLLPADKLAMIQQLQARGEKVGMVGDGINDAAALAAADVGFAMGEGADVAMESADVTLLSGSLAGIERSVRLSRLVVRNIHQNLVAAFGYNLLLIPVAAGVLYPWTGLLINPALAGLAMAASSITVVLNAARLRIS